MGLNTEGFTAKYVTISEGEGERFQFFCEVSNTPVYTSMPIYSSGRDDALKIAMKEARPYFNRCICCGKWVCDEYYHMDELLCVKCAKESASTK